MEIEMAASSSSADKRPRTYENLDLSRFKIVSDYSKHLMRRKQYTRPDYEKVKKDWDTMKDSLNPGTYVRVYQERTDLLRVMIVGPPGTAYHDGLMFYDLQLPANFPFAPPSVLDLQSLTNPAPRLNWEQIIGRISHYTYPYNYVREEESISEITCAEDQSIMVMLAYLEKRFKRERQGPEARLSAAKEFMRTCSQTLEYLRKPPQHFEDIVYNHFHLRGKFLLDAFKAYATGLVEVGKYQQDDPSSNIVAQEQREGEEEIRALLEEDPEGREIRRLFERPQIQSLLTSMTEEIERNEEQGPKRRFTPIEQPRVHDDADFDWFLKAVAEAQGLNLNAPDTATSSGAPGPSTSRESGQTGGRDASRWAVGTTTPARVVDHQERMRRKRFDRFKKWCLIKCGIQEGRRGRFDRLRTWCLGLIKCGSLDVDDD